MESINGFQGENRWLSSFWPANIFYNDVMYPSVEHAYQIAKSNEPEKSELIVKMINLSSTEMKKLGKKIKVRDDWNDIKLQVMEDLVNLKFSDDNPELKQKLIDTGDVYLEETNNWKDVFWGVCKGVGENNLGKLLMKRRAILVANNQPFVSE